MNHHRPDFRPTAPLAALEKRAVLLQKLRAFFIERNFLEVETPLVSDEVIPELHIEPMRLTSGEFLQASPELHMKCLLAAGATAIFQVTRSFRRGEIGRLHNPEFTIVEWYRVGDDMRVGIDFLDELMQVLIGTPAAIRTSYAEAFERTVGLCPHTATIDDFAAAAAAAGIYVPPAMNRLDRDEWLNLLLAFRVEPQLGLDRPEVIYHYPVSQASLARTVRAVSDVIVAERFELYYRGVELANGFHELADAPELRRRFHDVNSDRVSDNRPALPLPIAFLTAMKHGLPDCTGVALGFDRLAMLGAKSSSIDDVIAFPRQGGIAGH